MGGKGSLILDFFDVLGDRPNDRADIFLKHQTLNLALQLRDQLTSKRLRVNELDSTQGGLYSILVFPMRHRPVGLFIRVMEGQPVPQRFVLPVDPLKVSRVDFPPFAALGGDLQQLLSHSSVEGDDQRHGVDLYDALDNFQRAGLLNIYAKMKATVFQNGRDVFSYFTALTRVRGARFFGFVQKDLRDQVKNSLFSGLFHEVSGVLHTPPPNFMPADSFKTRDRYGNLQLTFFSNPQTLEFIVDADIDEAQGIEHIFQVVSQTVSSQDSNPYDIHEILMAYQKINPGYSILV